MKVSRVKEEFQPVTLVVESKYELDTLMSALFHYQGSIHIQSGRVLYTQIKEVLNLNS